jgi:hypothetical protein
MTAHPVWPIADLCNYCIAQIVCWDRSDTGMKCGASLDLGFRLLAYLPHPLHQAVVAKLLPMLEGGVEGVVAFDFIDGVMG